MAKYVAGLNADLDAFAGYLENEIIGGSMSATKEDEFRTEADGVRILVQVYERYSWAGGNRVSLSVTMVACRGFVNLAAIASGGSQAMFFKINTFGEEAFLDKLREAVEAYR